MENIGRIKDLIKNIGGGEEKAAFFTAKVKSVKGDTCTVLIGDLELTEVRLRAVIDNDDDDTLRITPKKDSMVLVADLSDGAMRDLIVVKYTQAEMVELKRGEIDINITGGDTNEIRVINKKTKINLKEDEINIHNDKIEVNLKDNKINVNNGYSLLTAFEKLIDKISEIQVATAMGPAPLLPLHPINLGIIKTEIKGLLY